jgi:uncharacterized protein YvpB
MKSILWKTWKKIMITLLLIDILEGAFLLHLHASSGRPSDQTTTAKVHSSVLAPSALLTVQAQSQYPELYNGCEVTSLSMLLDAAGHPVDKIQLAESIAKDPTPEIKDDNGNIQSWGDPNRGFVGDITGGNPGYGVYHQPVFDLLNQIMSGSAMDLTGHSFTDLLQQVSSGVPVIVWTTTDFQPTHDWITWQSPDGLIHATLDEHVVLLVGYNDHQVFVNDPQDGSQAKPVDRSAFQASWEQLGRQAVTFAKLS